MEGYRESKFFNFHVFPRTVHVSSSARRSPYVKVEILNFPRLVKGVRFTFLPLHDDHHMWKPSKVEILKFYVSREVSPYVSSSVHVEAIENRKRVFVLRFFFCATIIIIRRGYRESKFWISTPRERFRLSCSVHVKTIENRNLYPDNDCAEKLSKIEILNFHASWRAFVSSFFLCIPRIEIFEFLFILKRLSAFLSLRDDHRRLEVIESRNFESPRVAKNIYLNMFLTCSLAQREILIFHAYREDHSRLSPRIWKLEISNFHAF